MSDASTPAPEATPAPESARSPGAPPRPESPPAADEKQVLLLVGLSLLVGTVVAFAASGFVWLEHELQHLVWHSLPEGLGLDSTPWWFVVAALLVGAGIVMLAWRIPGGGYGHAPVQGLHFDVGPSQIASVLVAALGSLVFGAVIGPEAPLIALGTAIGALLMRGRPKQVVQLAMVVGGAAAIGAIFGNPLITAFMLLEFAAMGLMPAAILLPSFIALGASYVVQVGVGAWNGVGTGAMEVPGLTAMTQLTWGALLMAVVVGAVAAVLALAAREGGERMLALFTKRPAPTLLVTALVTAGAAIVVQATTDQDASIVLFSGQAAMPQLLAETSVGAVLPILAMKMVAYAVGLGGGFRGGPIFPGLFLGVGVGVLTALVIPELSQAGMVVAGMAGATTAVLRLPLSGALFAVFIGAGAGAEATPLAIIGSVVGLLARMLLDRIDARRTAADFATATATATAGSRDA